MNLVEKVMSAGTTLANYSYLSDGTKLGVRRGDVTEGFAYLGSMVYALRPDGSLIFESTTMPQGRLRGVSGSGGMSCEPQYFVTDHLGSVRAVVGADGQVAERSDYYPLGGRWSTPDQAISDNRYQFNGKERQVTGGVNWLDYGARMYDDQIGRWLTQDPLSEKYPWLNPYVFCANNPVKFVDRDGRDAVIVVYPDYKISTPIGQLGGLGHAGVLLIDNTTGVTKYYEYGRYDKEGVGVVRNITVSNVVIQDGKPTQESLGKVLSQLSEKAGHNGRVEGAYINSDNFKAMNDYAQSKIEENSDTKRPAYSLTGNNCGTFAADVVKQDEKVKDKAPVLIDPRPNSIITEYQSIFPSIEYNPQLK